MGRVKFKKMTSFRVDEDTEKQIEELLNNVQEFYSKADVIRGSIHSLHKQIIGENEWQK